MLRNPAKKAKLRDPERTRSLCHNIAHGVMKEIDEYVNFDIRIVSPWLYRNTTCFAGSLLFILPLALR